MYNPPNQEKWVYTHTFLPAYKKAYDEGYNAPKGSINPYESSDYERELTFNDEMHYWWYRGNSDNKQ